jgi:hypothetical protein
VPPQARSASLEGSRPLGLVPPRPRAHAPSSGFRLARGLTPPRAGSASIEGSRPLERVPPRSRAHAPSSGFRLTRGPTPPEQVPPRSRVPASLERAPPRSRLPHERTCSCTRVQAFNALTQQSRAITRLRITPRRCSANSLGGAHPRHCGGLCDEAGVSFVTLCCPL